MSFATTYAASRRLALLRLLREAGGRLNESVLFKGALQLGFARTSRDDVRTDLDLFKDRGLTTETWHEQRLRVVSLTDRGLDCAAGRLPVDDIEQPDRIG